MNDVQDKLDLRKALVDHSYPFSGRRRDIDCAPPNDGPRSLTRTMTERPLATLVTRSRVPNGNVE